MKISLAMALLLDVHPNIDEACAMMKEAGFTHIDYHIRKEGVKDEVFFNESIESFIEYFEGVRQIIDKHGLIVHQSHAPFGLDEVENCFTEDYENLIQRAIIATNILGGKFMVVHPLRMQCRYTFNQERAFELNYQQMKRFEPYLEKYNVKIALENLYIHDPSRKNFFVPTILSDAATMNRMLERLGSKHFVSCFDTGHSYISSMEPIYDHITKLGKNLQVLHITDNNRILDDHLIPYSGRIDWEGFIKGVKEVGFDGVYDFELVFREPKAILPAKLKYIVETAKYLISRIHEV